MRIPILPLLLLVGVEAAAQNPAPPLSFEADTILAGGHVLAEATTLSAEAGPVILRTREGTELKWQLVVENGETRLIMPDGRWAAKAEYTTTQRGGRKVCQIYQTYWSPEWAVRGGSAATRPDYRPADDRVYAFREVPCP